MWRAYSHTPAEVQAWATLTKDEQPGRRKGLREGRQQEWGSALHRKQRLVSSELHMGRPGSVYAIRFLSEQMAVPGEKHAGLTKSPHFPECNL